MTTLSKCASFRYGEHDVVIHFLTTAVESRGECCFCKVQTTGQREWVFPIEVSIDDTVVDISSAQATTVALHLNELYKHGQIACEHHKLLLASSRKIVLGL